MLLFQDPSTFVQPPEEYNAFLVWAVGVLIAAVISVWVMYKQSTRKIEAIYEARIADQAKVIQNTRNDLEAEHQKVLKLIAEIKPALEASNQIAQSVFNLLTNGKK